MHIGSVKAMWDKYKELNGFNTYTDFKEYLETRENIKISVDEVRVILRDKYIFSPRTHKSTKKKFRKKLEEDMKKASKKEKEILDFNFEVWYSVYHKVAKKAL